MYCDIYKIDAVHAVLHVRSELRKPCSAYEDAQVFTRILPNIPCFVLLQSANMQNSCRPQFRWGYTDIDNGVCISDWNMYACHCRFSAKCSKYKRWYSETCVREPPLNSGWCEKSVFLIKVHVTTCTFIRQPPTTSATKVSFKGGFLTQVSLYPEQALLTNKVVLRH